MILLYSSLFLPILLYITIVVHELGHVVAAKIFNGEPNFIHFGFWSIQDKKINLLKRGSSHGGLVNISPKKNCKNLKILFFSMLVGGPIASLLMAIFGLIIAFFVYQKRGVCLISVLFFLLFSSSLGIFLGSMFPLKRRQKNYIFTDGRRILNYFTNRKNYTLDFLCWKNSNLSYQDIDECLRLKNSDDNIYEIFGSFFLLNIYAMNRNYLLLEKEKAFFSLKAKQFSEEELKTLFGDLEFLL